MSPEGRLRLTGALAAAVELVLAVLLLGSELALYFAVTALVTVTLTWVAAHFMTPPPPPPDDPGPPGDPEPPWWPEFERRLQAHVHDRQPV